MKCNVDARFHPDELVAATGVVIRGEHGQMIGGKSKWYASVPNALMAEALAC
uniref:RNase H type-1 domain-containing protein n=1 Tax=Oryza brachyantha TaxID=4533 RepID=J3MM17_ORYBR